MMSYRIHLGIIKKKDLDKHLAKTFSDDDEGYQRKNDFFNRSWDVELFDETPIEQFTKINGIDDEYPPHILSKEDVQTILNFYKQFLKDYFENKQMEIHKHLRNKDEELNLHSISIHFQKLKTYFEHLIKYNKNICEDDLFLFDYFYIVKLYDGMKSDEVGIITHG